LEVEMSQSVAFKCTYNDGDENVFVGFADTCSKENIERNIKARRIWCSNQDCKCSNYLKGAFKGTKPINPCMESQLFREWKFSAGVYHHGERAGQPIHLSQTANGKFAILTTRFPDEPESERRIIGLFQIERIESRNEVFAARRGRIRLPLEEAKELYFWSYATTNAKSPDWRTGLVRYLDDSQVHRILADVLETLKDEQTKQEIGYLIKKSFGGIPAPPASGCLPKRSTDRAIKIAKQRKYGRGGEGKDHKNLKEYIARHPEAIGLRNVSNCECDTHRFVSGDLVDLVFTHSDGKYTVVEIETIDPWPGAHQTIKYRSLLSAENRLDLANDKVKAVLVAWDIPANVRDFCTDYSIDCREYKV